MKLYVTRHAAAEDASAAPNDFDRAVTLKGRKRAVEVARVLLAEKETPDIIVASPLVRAVQTAEIIASVTNPPEGVAVRQELAPGNTAFPLLQELGRAGTRGVMLVGHEPGLSELMIALLGDGAWPKGFTKSMVACVKIDEAGVPKLRWVLDPKSLRFTSHR
jgi:phosphohistidine phosphatase